MAVTSNTLRKLAGLALSPEQMAGVLELLAEQQEAEELRLAAQRNRKAKQRSRDKDVTVTGQDRDTPSPKKETSPTPPKEKTTPTLSEASASSITPRAELETVLDKGRAAAVLDHRKRIGKPMTAHAAKLLASQFAKCPDPNAAADKMVRNGWQGFEPEWLDRPTARGSPPKRGMGAVFGELGEFLDGQADGNSGDEATQGAVLSLPYRRTN